MLRDHHEAAPLLLEGELGGERLSSRWGRQCMGCCIHLGRGGRRCQNLRSGYGEGAAHQQRNLGCDAVQECLFVAHLNLRKSLRRCCGKYMPKNAPLFNFLFEGWLASADRVSATSRDGGLVSEAPGYRLFG